MKTILLSMFVFAALFACNTKKNTTKVAVLTDSSWIVTHLGEEMSNVKQTLTIAGEKVEGKAACNNYGGVLSLKESHQLSISDIFATKMGCPNLEAEKQYFQSLRQAQSYQLESDQLVFFDADKKQLVKFKKAE